MSTLLREFAERYAIPVATTLSAKGVLPEDHLLSLGNFGCSGSRRALETLLGDEPDLILALGADFNERDSCCWDNRLRTNGRSVFAWTQRNSIRSVSLQTSIATVIAWSWFVTGCVTAGNCWPRC